MSEVYRPSRRGNRRPNNEPLVIEGAALMFRNFRGGPTKFNSDGGLRTFCVELDDELAEIFSKMGFNVSVTKPKNDDYEPVPYMKINVSYRYEDNLPSVNLYQGGRRVELTESSVGTLDFADIIDCDVVFKGSPKRDGSGLTAYLQTIHVTIREDAFRSKYAQYDEDVLEEVPFE